MNNSELVLYLINKFRKIQYFVRLLPFILVALHLCVMVSYSFLTENICIILDLLFYVSPIMLAVMLKLSYLCDLCNWHRTECCMIVLSPLVAFIDDYIISFSDTGLDIGIIIQVSIFLISIISMYFVFKKD